MKNLDRHFVQRFHQFRAKKMAVQSPCYDLLFKMQTAQRQQEKSAIRGQFQKPLSSDVIAFYNEVFEFCFQQMSCLLEELDLRPSIGRRALKIYSAQLPPRASLRDLLAMDVFGAQTQNQDIPVDLVIAGLSTAQKRRHLHNTFHFFLHRPQQTEFLYLHEVLVGHFVNHMMLQWSEPLKNGQKQEYRHWSPRVLKLWEKKLKLPRAELLALHFEDSLHIKKKLKPRHQQLFHLCAHVAWYVELFNQLHLQDSTDQNLISIYKAFSIPAFQRSGSRQKLSSAAARWIDTVFYYELILPVLDKDSEKRPQLNRQDLERVMLSLVERLWEEEA